MHVGVDLWFPGKVLIALNTSDDETAGRWQGGCNMIDDSCGRVEL